LNLIQILAGSAARFLTVPPLVGGKLFGIHLVRALESRYGFLVSPKNIEEFDLQKGIIFKGGYLHGKHIVSRVELYNNGIRVETSEGTVIADQFIDDLLGWLAFDAGIEISQSGLKIYNSSMEVEMPVSFSHTFERLDNVGIQIGNFVNAYGGPDVRFETVGFVLWTQMQNQGPGQFRIERRLEKPFEDNVFFSSAPLSTTDHLAALSALEGVFS